MKLQKKYLISIALLCAVILSVFSLNTFASTKSKPKPKPPAAHNPVGHTDVLNCDSLQGWTCDANDYNAPIYFQLYSGAEKGKGGNLVVNSLASVARPDVAPVCGGNPNHGFSVPIPPALKDGKSHKLFVYGINIGPGSNKLISSKSLKCATAAAPVVAVTPSQFSTLFGEVNGELNQIVPNIFGVMKNGARSGDNYAGFSDTQSYKAGQNINIRPLNPNDLNQNIGGGRSNSPLTDYPYLFNTYGGQYPYSWSSSNDVSSFIWFGDEGVYSEGNTAAGFWSGINVKFTSYGPRFVRFIVQLANGDIYASPPIWFNIGA